MSKLEEGIAFIILGLLLIFFGFYVFVHEQELGVTTDSSGVAIVLSGGVIFWIGVKNW